MLEDSSRQSLSNNNVLGIPNIVLNECIALFFQWHHPYSMIVERHVFMADFLSSPRNCSSTLLYAICALGASVSEDSNVQELAHLFLAAVDEEISARNLWVPHLSTSQAMLLIAVFETGRGNSSKAWMYSGSGSPAKQVATNLSLPGMAFRMAQDLGIHEKHPPPASSICSDASVCDPESRRRIASTYHISDKFPIIH